MCTSKTAGGRRCAAHTRPAFQAALHRVRTARASTDKVAAQADGMADIARHAATPAGASEVRAIRESAHTSGNFSLWLYLEGCLNVAKGMRQMHAAIDKETAARVALRALPRS